MRTAGTRFKSFCTVQNTGFSLGRLVPQTGSAPRPAASPSQQCRAAHAARTTTAPRRGQPTTHCTEIPSLYSPVMPSETS